MKFSEFPVILFDIEEVKAKLESLFEKFSDSASFEEEHKIFLQIVDEFKEYNSSDDVAHVRYITNSLNEKYASDKNYFDEINPSFWMLGKKFTDLIASSRFTKDYEKKYGTNYIKNINRQKKTFSENTKEDFKKEKELVTEYEKLLMEPVKFEGEKMPISKLRYFYNSPDKTIRKKSNDAYLEFYNARAGKINDLFNQLYEIRNSIAKKLGFKNYLMLGYENMCRDYDYIKAGRFRESVVKYVVPAVEKLKEKQRIRTGEERTTYYNSSYKFKTGNPIPKCSAEEIIPLTKKMYSELSAETKEFFDFMVENELMDLNSRIGKGGGGFCTFFQKYKSPFIFSNLNGTANDVEILTHEAGHAFQSYLCRNYTLYEEMYSSSDTCEVHSMSMEFLTYDYMHLFFKEDTEKFYYYHLDNALRSIISSAITDEFQEIIYLKSDITQEERKKIWNSLREKYKFEYFSDNDINEYFNSGNSWHLKSLIIERPFYCLEYALAQFAALQFLFMKKENHNEAFKKYVEFCKIGGRNTFEEQLNMAGIKNPFNEETVKTITEKVEKFLEEIDDSNF